MDRSRVCVAAAVALCVLSRVEYSPAFSLSTATLQTVPGHSNLKASTLLQAEQRQPQSTSGWPAAALVVAAVGLSLSRRASSARVQLRADSSGLTATGPVATYTKALMEIAEAQKESTEVTKDVMKLRRLYEDEAFLDKLFDVMNEVLRSDLERAHDIVKLIKPLESTIMEKFVIFLAKKRRLLALKSICNEYVSSLYFTQSVAPVIVRSAQKLTEAQEDKIKEKMKVKTGTSDIKLISQVDPMLVAGFVVEYGFVDPEDLSAPSEGIDLSLKTILGKACLNKGVLVEV